jgi:hypothetical protein
MRLFTLLLVQMRRLVVVIIAIVLSTPLLTVGGIGVSLVLENQDAFCASCHTEPESKYYNQSIQKNPATLAAFHTLNKTGCIDCHSGGGALGRAQGLQQGADDLMLYLSGNYKNPAITSNPLGDDSCLKCHANNLQQQQGRGGRGTNGHYHFYLLQWQAVDPLAAHCVTCHTAHTAELASLQYMTQGKVAKQCELSHGVERKNEIVFAYPIE